MNDIQYLNTTSAMLKTLRNCRELNLSMNDFSQAYMILINVVVNCKKLNCLSISYCQIPVEIICQQLSSHLVDTKLKILFLQSFTPPPMHEILDLIHCFCKIKSLQKFCFLPSLYAFPGSNDYERESNAMDLYQVCFNVFEAKNRSDIDIFSSVSS